jgi:hypothetical protein
MSKQIQKALSDLAAKWPSTFVAREQIHIFTGGVISKGRMANLDSLGEGPERFRLGRKICYPVDPLIKWLADRVEPVDLGV